MQLLSRIYIKTCLIFFCSFSTLADNSNINNKNTKDVYTHVLIDADKREPIGHFALTSAQLEHPHRSRKNEHEEHEHDHEEHEEYDEYEENEKLEDEDHKEREQVKRKRER